MDPNIALEKARRALDMIRQLEDEGDTFSDSDDMANAGAELANAFEALDAWMSKGGFLPKSWER